MKSFISAAAVAMCLASAAHAQTRIEVSVPADTSDKAAAEKYVAEVMTAVKRVCAREASPVIGPNYHRFTACVDATREAVAAKDPTGLMAAGEEAAPAVLAAR